MAYLAFAVFVLLVAVLTRTCLKGDRIRMSCCAPADPADDLRMRAAFEDFRPTH